MKTAILFATFLVLTIALGCDIQFTCKNESTVVILGSKFTCEKGLICNESPEKSCQPCVEKPPTCPFKCKEDSINLNGLIIKCRENYVCNQEPDSDCKMCVRRKCNQEAQQFECDDDDDSIVKIGNYRASCNSGYKCNKDYVEPCEPCISRDDRLNQPFVQPAFNISEAPEPIVMPRGIFVPDEDMINCNDGKSCHQPCRPGVPGANYYFKCSLTTKLTYSTSIKPCTSLYSDKRCRKVQDLCLP